MNKRIKKKKEKQLNQLIPLGYGFVKDNSDHCFKVGQLVKIIAHDNDGFVVAVGIHPQVSVECKQILETYQIDMNIKGLQLADNVFEIML